MATDKEALKAQRQRLHKIYLDHDVEAFRQFLKDHQNEKYEFVALSKSSYQELSALMHNMKSQLMYLGEEWQKSRNFMRYETLWKDTTKKMEEMPICATCEWFKTAPSEEESPCMQLGSTPADICCPAYQALK